MELKVHDSVFYLLDIGEEKWVFDTEESAIGSLKKLVSNGKQFEAEHVNIFEVNISGEKWAIQAVSWSKIAMGLMRGN